MQQIPHDEADRGRQIDAGADAVKDRRHLAHVTGHDGHARVALGDERVQVESTTGYYRRMRPAHRQ